MPSKSIDEYLTMEVAERNIWDFYNDFKGNAYWFLSPEAWKRVPEAGVNPDIRALARRTPKRALPEGKDGPASVFYAFNDASLNSRPESPLIMDAFVLPLQWREGVPSHTRLPESLLKLADRVVQMVQDSRKCTQTWGLHFHPCVKYPDPFMHLFGVCDTSESAWASLTGSLVTLTEGREVKPGVAASAAWDDGLRPVNDLGKKIECAKAFGVEAFFTSPYEAFDDGAGIRKTLRVEQDPLKALSPYLVALGAPPKLSEGADYDARLRYANLLEDVHDKEFERYLIENVIPTIVDGKQPDNEGVDALVLLVSKPSTAVMTLHLVKPTHALMLYSNETVKDADLVKDGISGLDSMSAQSVTFDDPSEIPAKLREFFGQIPEGAKKAVDITGGKKDMTAQMVISAIDNKASVLYLDSDYGGGKRLIGSERLVRVKAT